MRRYTYIPFEITALLLMTCKRRTDSSVVKNDATTIALDKFLWIGAKGDDIPPDGTKSTFDMLVASRMPQSIEKLSTLIKDKTAEYPNAAFMAFSRSAQLKKFVHPTFPRIILSAHKKDFETEGA